MPAVCFNLGASDTQLLNYKLDSIPTTVTTWVGWVSNGGATSPGMSRLCRVCVFTRNKKLIKNCNILKL